MFRNLVKEILTIDVELNQTSVFIICTYCTVHCTVLCRYTVELHYISNNVRLHALRLLHNVHMNRSFRTSGHLANSRLLMKIRGQVSDLYWYCMN